MRNILATVTCAMVMALAASCSETRTFDDHANWKQRNTDFIAGIADSCDICRNQGVSLQNAAVGQMFRIASFELDSTKEWSRTGGYVYCKVISKGKSAVSPLYTDSIKMNFRARLIPTDNYPEGQVIDQSFKTDQMDTEVNIPSKYLVSNLIDGVSTAVMHMHPGDRWMVYIPYGLGYGKSKKSDIPAYSALIFDINLTDFSSTGHSFQ